MRTAAVPSSASCTIFLLYLTLLLNPHASNAREDYCDARDTEPCSASPTPQRRYMLYDVNPPEGFNLRRDVYLRLAVFAHSFRTDRKLRDWLLVLPPWPHLYHWQSKDVNRQKQLPWSHFFDVPSLQRFAPVLEMYELFNELRPTATHMRIDEVYHLQHVKGMFETGNFEETIKIDACEEKLALKFYGFHNISALNEHCLSFHGHASMLRGILENTTARMVLFNHAEIPLHDVYGDPVYWQGRRSMRFNKALQETAANYRLEFFNSTDTSDNTLQPDNWLDEKPKRDARGGQYICAHVRRKDFLWGRPDDVPSLENAAKQIEKILKKRNHDNVFIATDAQPEEYAELVALLAPYHVYKYEPEADVKERFKDGGIAIVEQIICSHAAYFIGTHESTFSFRIQEEREIIGFPADTTFNRFCGDKNIHKCSKPSIWKITY